MLSVLHLKPPLAAIINIILKIQVVNQWQQQQTDPGSIQQHSDPASNNATNIWKQHQHLLEVGGSLYQNDAGGHVGLNGMTAMTKNGMNAMTSMTNNGLHHMANNCMTRDGIGKDGWGGVNGMIRDDEGSGSIDDDVFNKHFFNNRILSVDDIQQLMQNGRYLPILIFV